MPSILALVSGLFFAGGADAQTADGFLIVDCLLPPQIRQLGQRITYPSPRRPVKTTASECQIRGGEYVAYDRADYATALQVWLPMAEEGDPEASANVGEIYEKGLGVPPDYEAAVGWYRSAADAGNIRAQINLGHLYEQGLGVERDFVEALEWYRRASGLDDSIQLLPAELSRGMTIELETLRDEVEALRGESESLRRALEAARAELGVLNESGPSPPEREIDEANREAEASLNEVLVALNEQVEQRTQEALRLANQVAALRAELAATEAELGENSRALDEQLALFERAAAELGDVEQERELRQQELDALAESLGERQRALADEQSVFEDRQRVLLELEAQVAALETNAAERRTEIAALRTQQTALLERVLAGPEIVLIDPQLQATRAIVAVPAVAVAAAGGSRQIVGQVTAPAGLLSLSINGERVDSNAVGVFSTSIPLTAGDAPVAIVAVDQQGKRADLEFVLKAPAETVASAAGTEVPGGPTRPELPDVDFGNYHALLIGNDAYSDLPSLQTASNDARVLAEVLEDRYGFETRTLFNATRYEILSALNDYREQLTSEDNLLVYYAGHGSLDEVNARGHWLPVDAEPDSTANWISNIEITDQLNVMRAKQILVVVDSCYSGSMTRSSVGRLEVGLTEEERIHWLRTMAEKRARMVLTSGGLEPVLDSGGGEHSVFAKALVEVLGANAELIDGQQLYQAVAARVAYAAANVRFEQVPEYAPIRFAGHEAGDFFFVPSF